MNKLLKKLDKKFWNNFTGIVFLLGIVLIVLLILPNIGRNNDPRLNSFAQCLSDKNIVMYGADWCPHCQNEKRSFGDSFQYVNYVECPDNLKKCKDEGIEGYPTWKFSDGRKLEGEQGLKKLSEESGCALPELN